MSSLANSQSLSKSIGAHRLNSPNLCDVSRPTAPEHHSQQTNRDRVSDHVAKLVAEAPPISDSTRAKLVALLGSHIHGRGVA